MREPGASVDGYRPTRHQIAFQRLPGPASRAQTTLLPGDRVMFDAENGRALSMSKRSIEVLQENVRRASDLRKVAILRTPLRELSR